MDEALRFGLAILSGGFVAVIAAELAFKRTAALQERQYAWEQGDQLQALVAELDENIAACGDGAGLPNATVRTAWDYGRRFGFSDSVRALLTQAYIAGRALNGSIAAVEANRTSSSAQPSFDYGVRAMNLLDAAKQAGKSARSAFEAARAALMAEIDDILKSARKPTAKSRK
ncbi:MAG TPA: hypothetical protein DCK98_15905 [Chloroflexi bacterium]|nr:hypothetical protein [Chloroflexota bacterium]HAL25736.1 hypothetical protein [Chloroflexota bacterium]